MSRYLYCKQFAKSTIIMILVFLLKKIPIGIHTDNINNPIINVCETTIIPAIITILIMKRVVIFRAMNCAIYNKQAFILRTSAICYFCYLI